MRKVLTSKEMRHVDAETVSRFGLSSLDLMENAAKAVVAEINVLSVGLRSRKVLILCGKGNNGGDGAAVARLLAEAGFEVHAILIGRMSETSGDAKVNFDRVVDTGHGNLSFSECAADEDVSDFFQSADEGPAYDLVVDALFGTGLTRPLEGKFELIVEWICALRSRSDRPTIVAVDIPSGLDADIGEVIGPHVMADVTVTFTAPKMANIMPPASEACGRLVVADIGSPKVLVDECESELFLVEPSDASKWLRATEFTTGSYKGKRGHTLLVAGSMEYSGAAALTANAAMMSGVGLVTVAAPKSVIEAVASRAVPEIILRGVAESEVGTIGDAALGEIEALIAGGMKAVGIGSGLTSRSDSTRNLVRQLVARRSTPLVIDADGLNALAPLEQPMSSGPTVVMTPHEGEFLRLLGRPPGESLSDRVSAARSFASEKNVFLVLKGPKNLVASPDGRVALVPTGNPGVAKAGGGDTLAGIITGFVAQGECFGQDVFETVVAAVYIAGLAGDIADRKYGKRVMLASDVRDCLAEAFRKV